MGGLWQRHTQDVGGTRPGRAAAMNMKGELTTGFRARGGPELFVDFPWLVYAHCGVLLLSVSWCVHQHGTCSHELHAHAHAHVHAHVHVHVHVHVHAHAHDTCMCMSLLNI